MSTYFIYPTGVLKQFLITHNSEAQVILNNFQPKIFDQGDAFSMFLDDENRIVANGSFKFVNGNFSSPIGRMLQDGSYDSTFQPEVRWLGDNFAMANGGNNKILLGGVFSDLNGMSLPNLIRLNSDGSLDATFQSDINFFTGVSDIILLSDGKILMCGVGEPPGTNFEQIVIRADTNGKIDPTFEIFGAPNGNFGFLAEQSAGQYLLSGVIYVNGNQLRYLVRLNDTGAYDPTFYAELSTAGYPFIMDYEIGTNGNIYIANWGSSSIDVINQNGGMVIKYPLTFRPTSLAVAPTGWIVAAGENSLVIVEFNQTIDPNFSNGFIKDILIQEDEKILFCGNYEYLAGQYEASISRGSKSFNNYIPDPAFQAKLQSNGTISDVARQANGNYLIAGFFDEINGHLIKNVASLDEFGNPDIAFDSVLPATRFTQAAIGTLSNGNFILGGGYEVASFSSDPQLSGLSKLGPDGTFQQGSQEFEFPFTYNPCSMSNTVLASSIGSIEIGKDDKIFALANDWCSTDEAGQNFVRLNSDGSLDIDIDKNYVDYLQGIRGVQPLPDGKFYVFGNSISYQGSNKTGIVRVNENGSLDNTFNTQIGTNTWVDAVDQVDGHVYLHVAPKNQPTGLIQSTLEKLDLNGAPVPAFNKGIIMKAAGNILPIVEDITTLSTGLISVSGVFDNYNGIETNNLVIIDQNGAIIGNITQGLEGIINRVIETDDNIILAVGNFYTAGGQHTSIVKIDLTEVLGDNVVKHGSRLNLYPNPVSSTLFAKISDADISDYSYEVFHVSGASTDKKGPNSASIQVADLPTGLYLLKVSKGDERITEMFVKH